jgi:inosose dehydratase
MALGYMTNAFGMLVGSGGGVTCMKDIAYVTIADDEDCFNKIKNCGYDNVEMFDGNLLRYADDPSKLGDILKKTGVNLLGVYVGGHFIYDDALEDELFRIEKVAKIASALGAKHLVVGGGSLRSKGPEESDIAKLAKALDQIADLVSPYNMIVSYHPHLGSLVLSAAEIDKLYELTKVNLCPDIAHLVAGGGDALEIIKKHIDRIKYIHFKDLSNDGFVPLGVGKIDLASIIDFLKSKNFSGDYLVEIDGYDGDPIEACRTSIEYLKGKLI